MLSTFGVFTAFTSARVNLTKEAFLSAITTAESKSSSLESLSSLPLQPVINIFSKTKRRNILFNDLDRSAPGRKQAVRGRPEHGFFKKEFF